MSTIFLLVLLLVLTALAIVFYYYYDRGSSQYPYTGGRPSTDHSCGKISKYKTKVKDLAANPRSRSEAEVVKHLEDITGKQFPSIYPSWLLWKGRPLELDGYNEALNLALEFSGPLHTKWTPTFEPYTAYFERVVRDVVKRRVCAKHGVYLIVVDISLPRIHRRNYLVSRLYDLGIVSSEPPNYIREQRPEPFRNPSLEAELGLGEDMRLAESM